VKRSRWKGKREMVWESREVKKERGKKMKKMTNWKEENRQWKEERVRNGGRQKVGGAMEGGVRWEEL
jgi:hypothetical protein